MYKYMRGLWKQPKENLGALWTQRLIQWRKQPVTVRIERPTRLDRARSLGYKPKLGVLVVRQRVSKGSHMRPKRMGGRRPKNTRRFKVLSKNYQQIAEERAAKSYRNCAVLNSYFVAKDGKNYWYEVILLDRSHPVVKADKNYANVAAKRGRAQRGLTNAARKARGQ